MADPFPPRPRRESERPTWRDFGHLIAGCIVLFLVLYGLALLLT